MFASFLGIVSCLSYWPRLRSISDVKKYIDIRKRVGREMEILHEDYSIVSRRKFETLEFYRQLKMDQVRNVL